MGGLIGGIVAILKYFNYKTNRDKKAAVGQAFNSVIRLLASESEVERLTGAVLLRRFFDTESEFGMAQAAYAQEAVNVMAAVLRSSDAGVLQKLLADGLSHAPTLEGADLQRTNLQSAYLGSRVGRKAQLSGADFFKADLSDASLKDAEAEGAVFYQARLYRTVLKGANLRRANFFEADLENALFAGAVLANANFAGAHNVPQEISTKLDAAGKYPADETPFSPAKAPASAPQKPPVRIFLSRPGTLNDQQSLLVATFKAALETEGMILETLERADYPRSGMLSEVRKRIKGCAGAVILGFRQLEVSKGVWRSGTPEEREVAGVRVATPWSQIEAGMAAMNGLPVLLVRESGVVDGIFDLSARDPLLHCLDFDSGTREPLPHRPAFRDWAAAARERARSGGS